MITVLFILLVVMILFLVVSYVFILRRFNKVDNVLKIFGSEAHSSNVHWQKVFENINPAKQIYPIHFKESQIIELRASMSVTKEMEDFVTNKEIARELEYDILNQLRPYIEVIIEKDIRRLSTNYYARVSIVDKQQMQKGEENGKTDYKLQ